MRQTVFVVGAGASCEFRLPNGRELAERIAKRLDIRFDNGIEQSAGDARIVEAYRHAVYPERDINGLRAAGCIIAKGMQHAPSIDAYISDQNDKNVTFCGKLAIVRSILASERTSTLYYDQHNAFRPVAATWLHSFVTFAFTGCTIADLPSRLRSITLIVFNYDRCIEHYLFDALQDYRAIGPDKAADILSNLTIYHPWGAVGDLPWQVPTSRVTFGFDVDAKSLVALTKNIRTFSESTDTNASDVQRIRYAVAMAGRIVYLGFAFHGQNVELLHPKASALTSIKPDIFATALNVSETSCAAIRDDLASRLGTPINRIHLGRELTCAKLFHEFEWNLAN